ncbi:hypothetical protein JW930_01780 [Candidatus Woesearchaeota archaeon]|nr:hypothetical protein [Candidatus Woesearchaeota archaeon]
MDKKYLFGIAAFIILFLSGCVELMFKTGHFEQMKSEPSNKFIGLWVNRTSDTANLPVTLSFQEGGRGFFDRAEKHVEFQYEILDNWTLKYTEYGESTVEMKYWFKDDDTFVLEMLDTSGKTNITWTRVVFKTTQID